MYVIITYYRYVVNQIRQLQEWYPGSEDMMMLVVDDLLLLARTISNCDAGAVVIAVVDDLIHCKL